MHLRFCFITRCCFLITFVGICRSDGWIWHTFKAVGQPKLPFCEACEWILEKYPTPGGGPWEVIWCAEEKYDLYKKDPLNTVNIQLGGSSYLYTFMWPTTLRCILPMRLDLIQITCGRSLLWYEDEASAAKFCGHCCSLCIGMVVLVEAKRIC